MKQQKQKQVAPAPKPERRNIKKVVKEEKIKPDFPLRNIFVILDDQDILQENLEFSYVEINDRLSKFVPEKVWKSQAAKSMNINQKVELNPPSQAMQEQSMLEILDEVSQKMNKQLESAYMIFGHRMRSPLDIPIETRIIVASTTEEFKGIRGLEHFESNSMSMVKESRHNVGGATFVNQ